MKRWLILAALVVVLASAATVAVQSLPASSAAGDGLRFPVGKGAIVKVDATVPTGPQPKAVVEGDRTYEFGTMPQQSTGKHPFVVKNGGRGDLELTMISSTCSCTLAKFKDGKKAVVKPGESTEIVLEFETRENNGDYSKGAKIGTNDPDLPEFSLGVHGTVYPAVMTYPPGNSVNYFTLTTDEADHVNGVALYSKDRPETKVLSVRTSKPELIVATHEPLSAEDCKQLQVERGVKVLLNVKTGLPLGNFREEVMITTDHPRQPETHLTLTGRMVGPVNLLPDRLIMHDVSGESGGRKEIMISVRNGRETKFQVAQVPKGLTAEVLGGDAPGMKGRYRLSVTVPPGSPAREISEDIVLTTDHPQAGKLIVPVSVFIQ